MKGSSALADTFGLHMWGKKHVVLGVSHVRMIHPKNGGVRMLKESRTHKIYLMLFI